MKRTTAYFCGECGNEFSKWQGKCPACNAWNSMTEQPVIVTDKKMKTISASPIGDTRVYRLDEIPMTEEIRFKTGLGELDRVLGGGMVVGSLVLVSGEPGIGKSTILLQICGDLSRFSKILYVSGEESPRQLKMRADRLKVKDLHVLAETDMNKIFVAIEQERPNILIIDSIQTMQMPSVQSVPGNVTQVKECTLALMQLAKSQGITVLVIGHVNKDGAIAGPKVLEHMVDCVLYFEGERNLSYRILRSTKNRFGSTNEIGVFDMNEHGLVEVPNPSEMLLSGRPLNVPGTCVACTMEGSRPVLAEIQALVTPTSFGVPRRTVSGIDYNRAMLLMAVLEKRGGLYIGNHDAYLNVVGGLRIEETASDLPSLLAIASSFKDKTIRGDIVAIGEVGLTGELRSVQAIELRLSECYRLGFLQCIIPAQGTKNIPVPKGLQVYRAKSIRDAMLLAFES